MSEQESAAVVFFDCVNGAAGDMLLSSLLDAGCPLEAVTAALERCGVDAARLGVEEVTRAGLRGLHLRTGDLGEANGRGTAVTAQPAPGEQAAPATPAAGSKPAVTGRPATASSFPRGISAVIAAVEAAGLPPRVTGRAVAVLRRLAEVEGALHGVAPDQVHLHELGDVDTLVDVVGVCAALEHLGATEVWCSPLPAAPGTVESAHGALPLPAPATLRLLADAAAPLIPAAAGEEHVTPTAAAILTTLARFGVPPMRLRRVGHGAGSRDDPRRPNLVRCWVGEPDGPSAQERPSSAAFPDGCVELRCNLDDAGGAVVADALARCLDAGALDAWSVPATMKKGRPGFILHVLVPEGADAAMAALLLRETPTLGVRRTPSARMVAERDVVEYRSPLGPVRVKRKHLDGRVVDARPELDDCRRIAAATLRPLHEVIDTVTTAARAALTTPGR